MRVLIGIVVSVEACMPLDMESLLLVVFAVFGGERQRKSVAYSLDYSIKSSIQSQKPSYLEPNSSSMHVPIGEGSTSQQRR